MFPRLKNPIVLVHGLGAKSMIGPVDYYFGMPSRLREIGNEILIADLTAWQSIDHRAAELKIQIQERILAHNPEARVNLIGHSMGGLDARYLASMLDFSQHVASVTTVGTPNHGSAMADIALGFVPGRAFERLDGVLKLLGSSSGGFRQITRKHSEEVFNQQVVKMPGVRYFSATSAITGLVLKQALPFFWVTNKILQEIEGDNDGFVSVETSKWGDHICTYVGDHYGQVGQPFGRTRGLDHLKFFGEIFGRLAAEGL